MHKSEFTNGVSVHKSSITKTNLHYSGLVAGRDGDFSWTLFSKWVNSSGHFLRVNSRGHFW